MNYLAHLFLSCDHPEWMLGNFLADHLTLHETKLFDGEIENGINLHKMIDTFTDNHHDVREATKFLSDSQGKYAPVVIDIYFDYLLYKNWETYTSDQFDTFCQKTYQILMEHLPQIPVRLHDRVKNMVKGKWLDSYKTKSGLEFTFLRLETRVRFENNLSEAVNHLSQNESYYNQIFNSFFPDVIANVRKYCDC